MQNRSTTRRAGYRCAAAVGALILGLAMLPSTGHAQQNVQASAAMQKQLCAQLSQMFSKGLKIGGGSSGGGQMVLQMGSGSGKPVFSSDSGKAKPAADTAAAKPMMMVAATGTDTASKPAAQVKDTAQAGKTDSAAGKSGVVVANGNTFTCTP